MPEIGFSVVGKYGFIQNLHICVRVNGFGSAVSEDAGPAEGAIFRYCKCAPGWGGLESIILIPPDQRTELQRRISLALAWAGQAAFSRSPAVRIVALMSALETLLIRSSETLGKRKNISIRTDAFPKMYAVRRHIDKDQVDRLYRIRSACLHSGKTRIADSDVVLASIALAQVFDGILSHPDYAKLSSLDDLLKAKGLL
jgi:hypothetical protein